MNEGVFKGKITELIKEFSTFDKEFVEAKFVTKRLSNAYDEFNVIIKKNVFKNLDLNKFVELRGSVRSKNTIENEKNRLKIYIYTEYVFNIDEEEYENKVSFDGFLTKEPILRETPMHRVICDFLLANNKSHCRSYYLPCIAWESNANFISKFKPNHSEKFICQGRLQSREYKKVLANNEIETRVAYEISINDIAVSKNEIETVQNI